MSEYKDINIGRSIDNASSVSKSVAKDEKSKLIAEYYKNKKMMSSSLYNSID